MAQDILSRDPQPTAFEMLPADIQATLRRAVRYRIPRQVPFTPKAFVVVGRDWIMVPSKRGLRWL